MGIYGNYLTEGFFKKKKNNEIERYIKLANKFILNPDYLGYNDAEFLGILLALKFMNISESEILSRISNLKTKMSGSLNKKCTIKEYLENYIDIDVDLSKDININDKIYIFCWDFIPSFYNFENKKVYYIDRKNYNTKECSIYKLLELANCEKGYFTKKEFDKVKKELENKGVI